MPQHTGSQQLDSPRKNRFIGAVQSHRNISRAARDHGIRQSTAQSLWPKFQDTGSTANRPRSGRPLILLLEFNPEARRTRGNITEPSGSFLLAASVKPTQCSGMISQPEEILLTFLDFCR
jgi:transposase-like protein